MAAKESEKCQRQTGRAAGKGAVAGANREVFAPCRTEDRGQVQDRKALDGNRETHRRGI